jgi:hypothetical protein
MMDKMGAARIMQKFLVLILISYFICGCGSMSANNSTNIATDAKGFATGQYSDSWAGEVCGSAGALNMGQGNPLNFARSIAMINYSRRLDKISADDACGSREYTFTTSPIKQKNYQPFGSQVE